MRCTLRLNRSSQSYSRRENNIQLSCLPLPIKIRHGTAPYKFTDEPDAVERLHRSYQRPFAHRAAAAVRVGQLALHPFFRKPIRKSSRPKTNCRCVAGQAWQLPRNARSLERFLNV